MKTNIQSILAPAAIGPFSQAIQAGNFIYVSGQLPINVDSGEFAGEEILSQTKQSLDNIKVILETAGYQMDDVVKSTVYLANMQDFVLMNEVYASYFTTPFPARAAFEVARLPKDALVEIEVVAFKA